AVGSPGTPSSSSSSSASVSAGGGGMIRPGTSSGATACAGAGRAQTSPHSTSRGAATDRVRALAIGSSAGGPATVKLYRRGGFLESARPERLEAQRLPPGPREPISVGTPV